MKAADVRDTIENALNVAGIPTGQMPKLLTDNGACYISSELNDFLQEQGIQHIHGRINHPQTQGKIGRYHRSMKNIIKLDMYYTPGELKRKLGEFIYYYNDQRYHESLNNVTPADVYTGRANQIIKRRLKIKQNTLNKRKNSYFKNKLSVENKKSLSFVME